MTKERAAMEFLTTLMKDIRRAFAKMMRALANFGRTIRRLVAEQSYREGLLAAASDWSGVLWPADQTETKVGALLMARRR